MTISQKEIRRIAQSYQEYFPEWKLLGNDVLYRETGPVFQGILFDRASANVYKPTGYIKNLSSLNPTGAMFMELPQRLRHSNGAPDRSIGLQHHERMILDVVGELKKQLKPSIEKEL